MLNVSKLNIDYQIDATVKPIVQNVSFHLGSSEQLAIVGESGSGKTMMALALMGLLPKQMALQAEQLVLENKDLTQLSVAQWSQLRNKDIGMVFQEPLSAFNPLHTIEKQLKEAIFVHRPDADWRKDILMWMDRVHLSKHDHILKAYPHELSGGQRQRVMIMMAMINQPKILIADEPTTALDVQVQVQILKLLKELQQSLDMALILITHDLPMVAHLADRVLVLKKGAMDALTDQRTLFTLPPTPYTKKLIKPYSCRPAVPLARKEQVLTVEHCHVYAKNKFEPIVKDVSFNLLKGMSLGLMGESGSGKTTLAMGLCRLMHATGSIHCNGLNWLNLSGRQLRRHRSVMQLVFQDPFSSLSPRMTVADVIAEGVRGCQKDGLEQAVVDVMQQVKLDPNDRFRFPHAFSGGERQRIAIARALIMRPDILILDEPTSALDRSIRDQVLNLLVEIQEKCQLAYLVITHDLKVIEALCHDVMVLRQGCIEESGSVQAIIHEPKQAYTKQLIAAQQWLVEDAILR